jgi:hypothetical protein
MEKRGQCDLRGTDWSWERQVLLEVWRERSLTVHAWILDL